MYLIFTSLSMVMATLKEKCRNPLTRSRKVGMSLQTSSLKFLLAVNSPETLAVLFFDFFSIALYWTSFASNKIGI